MTSTPRTSHPVVTVGYDESATSRAAVMWAAQEAVARAGALRIVTAWDPSPITPWGLPDFPKWRKHASQAAHRAAIVALDIARDHPDPMSVAIEGPARPARSTSPPPSRTG
jgi:hypothetical protein